jgi:hypothetical protein
MDFTATTAATVAASWILGITTGKKSVKKGNAHSGTPVAAWMVTNMKIKSFAHAHVGATISSWVWSQMWISSTTKNVGEDSLVDLVDHDGDAIVIPAVTLLRKSHRSFVVTRFEQSTTRLNAQHALFRISWYPQQRKVEQDRPQPEGHGSHPSASTSSNPP